MWSLILVHWEPVSVQDRFMVCAEHTRGSEIILDASDGTPAQKSFWTHPMVLLGDVGQEESRFGLLGASVGAR